MEEKALRIQHEKQPKKAGLRAPSSLFRFLRHCLLPFHPKAAGGDLEQMCPLPPIRVNGPANRLRHPYGGSLQEGSKVPDKETGRHPGGQTCHFSVY